MTGANWLRAFARHPVIQAPMAGGPSRPELAAAVSEAGGVGFVAAGYQRAADLAAQIAAVRAATGGPFGVNVFVPDRRPVDDHALAAYLRELEQEAAGYGVTLGPTAWTDDDWDAKLALLTRDPVPLVSFAFGCPDREVVTGLQRAGTRVVVTVTTVEDAREAHAARADALCVQGVEAGAHRGGATDDEAVDRFPLRELLAAVRTVTDLPVIAAGGLMDGHDVAAAVAAGADAVQLGTAFLLTPEAGTHPVYRAALTDPSFTRTDFTRAFSGRRARGLQNAFMERHPDTPRGYPQINNATRPLRAEAARRGDAHGMSLWAGTGYRHARAVPAGEVVDRVVTGSRALGVDLGAPS